MRRPALAVRSLWLAAAAALAALAAFAGPAAGAGGTEVSFERSLASVGSARVFTIVSASNRALLGADNPLDLQESEDEGTGAGYLSAADAAMEPELVREFLAAGHAGVPEWAPRVRDALAAEGIPFSAELLAGPVNVNDAARPLFQLGSHPSSLFGLGVLQAGENAFLRSLSAEELMLQVWPHYYRYNHRAAGSTIPTGYEAGMTFGQVIRIACDTSGSDGCVEGWTFRFSPIRSTDTYKRWVAYGMPGAVGDDQHNGYVVDDGLGWAYNPLTNEFFKVGEGYNTWWDAWRRGNLDRLMSGGIPPEHSTTDWQQVVWNLLGSRIAVAGYLRDPSIYFVGDYEGFAPDELEPETLARYRVLVQGG
jgi:hypothetical protein